MDQEQIMRLQMIEQEANQINQQLEIIDSNLTEMQDLKASLDEIEKTETKEFLANLGKKIFIPVEIKDKKLIVEVGNKNFVKKTIPETKDIIESQLDKLGQLRTQMAERIQEIEGEMNGLIREINSKIEKTKAHDKSCMCGDKHNHECNCEDDCSCEDAECNCKEDGCECDDCESEEE
jgi:prefoldin alpha subunit